MNRARIALLVLTTAAIVAGTSVWLWAQAASFGALLLSPPNIVYKQPTKVTFTIHVETPTLNPTTVELQKVGLQGNVLSTLGRLYDTGTNGDAVEGDKTFTASFSLNEPTVGKRYFRAIAGFRGKTPNAVSSIYVLDVDPFLLPPDPGEAGKATLKGIDADSDGLRDDVQRWIALEYYSAPTTLQSALHEFASANQMLLIASPQDDVLEVATQRHKYSDCLNSQIGIAQKSALYARLREILLNTKARSRAFYANDARLSGHFFPATEPSAWSQSCQ
jgi:hypothetical protein